VPVAARFSKKKQNKTKNKKVPVGAAAPQTGKKNKGESTGAHRRSIQTGRNKGESTGVRR